MRTVEYKIYWNLSYSKKRKGKLYELIIDSPDFLFMLSPQISLIPPFEACNEVFLSGGSQGGMSPGALWEQFEIGKNEYNELVKFLLEIDTSALKSDHPYAPDYIKIDHDLNEKYVYLNDWSKEVIRKYKGINWNQQFLEDRKYSLMMGKEIIGEIEIITAKRGPRYFGNYFPGKNSQNEYLFDQLSDEARKGAKFFVLDYWDIWQELIYFRIDKNNKIEFVPTFVATPPIMSPESLLSSSQS